MFIIPFEKSAGVGRTGTLITIDCVLEQLQEEKVVDIAGIIIHLRTQRMKMVQSVVSTGCVIVSQNIITTSHLAGAVYIYS